MEYQGNIYRPPSEARSLLVQVTIGCSHNKCTFCNMYLDKQFKIRSKEEVIQELIDYPYKDSVEKIFLCDGDALVLKTQDLLDILSIINNYYPNIKRVSCYSTFQDLNRKSLEDLISLKEAGLSLLYLGAESGSNNVLKEVNKDSLYDEMVTGSNKAKQAGFKLSVMFINGLGGQALSKEHALESAKLANIINPDYLGLLSLMIEPGTILHKQNQEGLFIPLSPRQVVEEMKLFVENLELSHCIFSSVHASNYINIKGIMNQDKERILQEIDDHLKQEDFRTYRAL